MAKTSGTVQPPLTESDLEYAKVLLAWGRSLDTRITRFEDFERRYWEEGERFDPGSSKRQDS